MPTHHKLRALPVLLAVFSILVVVEPHTGSPSSPFNCPVGVNAPHQAAEGMPIVFRADPVTYQSYEWSTSSGDIVSGHGTPSITVMNLSAGSSCTATVVITNQGCRSSGSATVNVRGMPTPIRFASYGDTKSADERELLDEFAIALQSDPGISGYIFGYGTCKQEGLKRANRVRDYLTDVRRIDARRLNVDGGCMRVPKTELWLVPAGAKEPEAETNGASYCRDCRTIPLRSRVRRRR